MTRRTLFAILGTIAVAAALSTAVRGQVGKGILDLNLISESDLAALPHMTPALAKAVADKRPFASIVEFNTFVIGQGLSQPHATDMYARAFVHVNLNTGTREEILLIPGAGRRMTIEFPEYRPWKSWAQFDKEIGKYVGAEATEKLKSYVFIPVNLNTATDEDILSIPGAGPRMVREFKEYRPWKSKEQFEREIGKYVNAKEVARLWRFVAIP